MSDHDTTYSAAECWLFTPVILVTQEAEIRRIPVQSQPWANILETLSQSLKKKKGPPQKSGVAQAVRVPA
jgi:hypothetical protein